MGLFGAFLLLQRRWSRRMMRKKNEPRDCSRGTPSLSAHGSMWGPAPILPVITGSEPGREQSWVDGDGLLWHCIVFKEQTAL